MIQWEIIKRFLPLIGAALFIAGAFGGWKLRGDHEEAKLYDQAIAYANELKARQEVADGVSAHLEETKRGTEATAARLRKDLNDARGQLSTCAAGQLVLTDRFMQLYNGSLQAGNSGAGQSTGGTRGTGTTDAEGVVANATENGLKWRRCRDQLRALIEVVK